VPCAAIRSSKTHLPVVSLVKPSIVNHTDGMSPAPPSNPGVIRFDPRTPAIPLSPVGDDRSTPEAGWVGLAVVAGMEVGVWDHTAGTSLHTEEDEIFVIISGRVTVTEDGGEPIDFGPGDVGVLHAGAKTAWVVHEPLRKVWISRVSPAAEDPYHDDADSPDADG
jgi:uncharacterized protein